MKRVVLLVVAVCLGIFAFAQDAAEKMNQANEALQNKEYAKALELYQEVLAIPDHGQNVEGINTAINQLKPIIAKENASDAIDNNEYDKAAELYKAAMADYPDDASIADQAGVKFYNAGITNYKSENYLDAAKCFTKAESDFKYEKAEKYKVAALKKLAEGLASEGKTSIEGVNVLPENKQLLTESLSKAYFDEGYELYKEGAALIKKAGEDVNNGSYTTVDDEYKNAVAEGKKKFEQAIPIMKKALAIDPNNANAKSVLDACEKSL